MNPKMSARFIYSKSACGMVVREEFTMPILSSNTIHGDTESVKHGFLLSPICPVNLLGRDMMLQPRISLISTPDGLKVNRTPSSPTMVKCNTHLFMFISGKFRFHYHKTWRRALTLWHPRVHSLWNQKICTAQPTCHEVLIASLRNFSFMM